MNRQHERNYREAMDGLHFSNEAKARMARQLAQARPAKATAFRPVRAGLMAACLCLALAGTALAAQVYGVRLQDARHEDQFWFEAVGGAVRRPLDDLSEEVRALEGAYAVQAFKTWAELEQFVGLNLMDNPVLDAAPAQRFSVSFDGRTGPFLARVYPDQSLIHAIGCFELGEADIELQGFVYTDRSEGPDRDPDDPFWGFSLPEEAELTREAYATPSGLEAQLLLADSPEEAQDVFLAAFSLNGTPFLLHVHSCGDVDQARTVLLQILDGFQL